MDSRFDQWRLLYCDAQTMAEVNAAHLPDPLDLLIELEDQIDEDIRAEMISAIFDITGDNS